MSSIRSYSGKTPLLGDRVFVDSSAVVIGDVTLADDASVWPCAVIRGDVNTITIGTRTSVQDNAVLHCSHKSASNPNGWPLQIGDDVTIGHRACLHGCIVGNRVLIGIGAIVLDGATVPDDVVIGAGTLVPPGKVLESGFLYVGSPCKKARGLKPEELAFFRYSSNNYVELKNSYLTERQS